MQDKARRKKLQLLQESLLKEEQTKYEKSKEEFAKGDNADIKEAPYIEQKYIEKISINGWDISDLKHHIEEVEEAKNDISKEYIKVSVKKDMSGYNTEYDGYVEVLSGHWIMGYALSPEQTIKNRAKNDFITAVSNEAHDRYIELNPEDKVRWKATVSCFLIEAFLNGEIEFDFLVRATYKECGVWVK